MFNRADGPIESPPLSGGDGARGPSVSTERIRS